MTDPVEAAGGGDRAGAECCTGGSTDGNNLYIAAVGCPTEAQPAAAVIGTPANMVRAVGGEQVPVTSTATDTGAATGGPVPDLVHVPAAGLKQGPPLARLRDLYMPLRIVGKGSFGSVVLAKERSTGEFCAVKVLSQAYVRARAQEHHTLAELSALSSIASPFVIGLKGAYRTETALYLVTEYASGGDLYTHMTRAGTFSEDHAKFFLAQIAIGLQHCHDQGVIYRDLKPENILIDKDGYAKLADFGLCKLGVTSSLRGGRSFCGTPEYLAPEVLNRSGHGFAADWWTLGMLAYELLTGLPPWFEQDRHRMYERRVSGRLSFPNRCHVSKSAESLIRGLLERNPTSRLGTPRAGDCGGAAAVLGHPFFGAGMRGVPRIVSNLKYRTIVSPLAAFIRGDGDTRNADPALRHLVATFSTATFDREAAKLVAEGADAASKRRGKHRAVLFESFGEVVQEDENQGGIDHGKPSG